MKSKSELEKFIDFCLYNININQDELHKSVREFKEKIAQDKIAKINREVFGK